MAGNPFTGGAAGNFWRIMPGATSKIWGNLTSEIRSFNRAGPRGHHSVISVDSASYNSRNLEWLLAFDKFETTRESKEAMQKVGEYIAHDVISGYFDQEGMPSNTWEELKQTTIDWRGGSDHPILDYSGALRSIATSKAAINEIRGGKNPRVVMGGQNWPSPEAEKFFVHMAGSWSQLYQAPIPKRPFMPQSEDDLTNDEQLHIKHIFQMHIERLMNNAKFNRI